MHIVDTISGLNIMSDGGIIYILNRIEEIAEAIEQDNDLPQKLRNWYNDNAPLYDLIAQHDSYRDFGHCWKTFTNDNLHLLATHKMTPAFLRDRAQRELEWRTDKKANKETPPTSGYIYLLKGDIYYKIGASKRVAQRLEQIEPLLPFPIKLIATISTRNMFGLESSLHKRFADKRVNGEWFILNDEDVAYIKSGSSRL